MTRRTIGWLILFAGAAGLAAWLIRDGERPVPESAIAANLNEQQASPTPRTAATPEASRVPVANEGDEPSTQPSPPQGARVHGQVVDESGQRVAGVSVDLRMPVPSSEPDGRPLSWSQETTSEPDGSFGFREPFPSGSYDVRVLGGLKLVSPAKLEVAPGTPEIAFTVLLSGALRTIRGRIVDENGEPVREVSVLAVGQEGADLGSSARDGRFTIFGTNRTAPVELRIQAQGFEQPPVLQGVAWGTDDLEIRIVRSGAIELQVVEAGTGAPIEEYALRCVPDLVKRRGGLMTSEGNAIRYGGRHEAGRVTIPGVSAGANVLIVFPSDDAFAPSDVVLFDKPERITPLVRVELHRKQVFAVDVVTLDGLPVADSSVQLLCAQPEDPMARPLEPHAQAAALQDLFAFASGPGIFIRWAEATTDRDGRATLRCAPPPRAASLRVLGTEHAPAIVRDVILAASGAPLRVVVEGGAVLRVRVQASGEGELEALAGSRVRLREDREEGRRLGDLGEFGDANRLARDGTLELRSLPAGAWLVDVEPERWADGSPRRGFGRGFPIGRVTLVAGQSTELTVPAAQFRPCSLSGRVTLNGAAFAKGELYFAGRGGGPFATTDALGAYSMTELDAGTWTVHLRGEGVAVRTDARRELAPGESAVLDVAVTLPRLVLRLELPDGRPAAGHEVAAVARLGLGSIHATTDADGRVAPPFAAPGTYDVLVHPPDWEARRASIPFEQWPTHGTRVDPIEVPARGGSLEIVRRLPQ
ncbi:MAG: carboxypeptidase regulatory-like domain-containing protein [Planctomycetes bacterium]|nr:carboxypeptidase regulatory-like domain-containing protein [Planctomycetota bacterium]